MSQWKNQDDFFQSASRGVARELEINYLEQKLLENRNQTVIDYVVELLRNLYDLSTISREQQQRMIQDIWKQADGELGSEMFSLLSEEEQDELIALQKNGKTHDELWNYFDLHMLNLEEEMAKSLYYFGLGHLINNLSLPQDFSAIEDKEVISLAERLEQDQKTAAFNFIFDIVRQKRGLPSPSTPEGKQFSTALVELENTKDRSVLRQLRAMLKVYDPEKFREYDKMLNREISINQAYAYFQSNLTHYYILLAVALLNFRKTA